MLSAAIVPYLCETTCRCVASFAFPAFSVLGFLKYGIEREAAQHVYALHIARANAPRGRYGEQPMSNQNDKSETPRHTNRLIHETSPYLLEHAHNPVDWYAWGEEALARAKAEDKPIVLSVGYSACHWCHVLAHESFENEDTARLMNENFINIKVDREERPDVDALYMDAVQALTGSGGWPMTVFLTPEGLPFYGGTYFPPQDRYGMPGFPTLLKRISDYYRSRRDKVEETAKQFRDF